MENVFFEPNSYLDFHTHLQRRQLDDSIIEIVSTSPQSTLENCYFTIGVHPWDISSLLKAPEKAYISNILSKEYCLGLGEVGLDKYKGPSIEIQSEVLKQQLELLKQFNKPVVVHCVKSFNEIIKIKREFPQISNWCIHGFNNNESIAKQLIEQGFYLSFNIKEQQIEKFAKILPHTPINKIFFETDNYENEMIEDVYFRAAKILNTDLQQLKAQIILNAKKFFDHE